MRVILAQPRGFCAGVVRAIETVEQALRKYGPPVYVRHEIVHNKFVVESLKAKGAVFVEELSEVPPRAVAIFSAHGVSNAVENDAAARGLAVVNATCPLVTKVHDQGKRYATQGPRIDPDRARRPPGGGGYAGPDPRPGPDHRRCRGARYPDRHAGCLCDPNHPERRRHARDHRRAGVPIYRYSRP